MDDAKFSVRKKITMWVLLLIIKIVEPTKFSHDYAKELEAIRELVKDL